MHRIFKLNVLSYWNSFLEVVDQIQRESRTDADVDVVAHDAAHF